MMNVSLSLQFSLLVLINHITYIVVNKYVLVEIDLEHDDEASYNYQKAPIIKLNQLGNARTLGSETHDESQNIGLKGNSTNGINFQLIPEIIGVIVHLFC